MIIKHPILTHISNSKCLHRWHMHNKTNLIIIKNNRNNNNLEAVNNNGLNPRDKCLRDNN